MPTYDYECKVCGHTFEAFQSMSEDPIRQCPECGKEVRRLISGGTGVIFRGTGFYVNDSKARNSAAPGKGKADAQEGAAASTSAADGGNAPAASSGNGDAGQSSADKAAPAAATTTAGNPAGSAPAASGGAASGATPASRSKTTAGASV